MKLVLETLRTLNLSAILFREFNLFIEIHQAALLPIQDKIFPDIKFRHDVDLDEHWALRKLVPFMLGRKGAVAVAGSSLQNRIHNEKSKFVSLASKLKALH